MQILVNQFAADLLERRSITLGEDVEVVCMSDGGALAIGSRECALEDIAPQAAWGTAHVFSEDLAGPWVSALHDVPSLRWFQSPAAGHLWFYDALLDRGVRITGAHVNAVPIAEYVLGAVLGQMQRVNEWRDDRSSRTWRPHEFPEVSGSTWLVVGVGAIGSAVAERARAFGAHIIGVRRRPTGREPVHEVRTPDEVAGLLPICDVVVLAAPDTPQTRGLVDEQFLASMKPGAILVNVARGALVDENALVAALDHGHLGAAILDVFATEPLPIESPLWDHPRVVVTPHSSAGGLGRHERLADLFADNLARYRSGRSLLHEVGRDHDEAFEPLDFATLDEIEREARQRIDADVWDYIAGGAGDEVTLTANEDAFGCWSLRPRLLTGAHPPDTATAFLGVDLATPLLVAPFAGDSLLNADGYAAVIEGAARVGATAIVPEVTAAPLETLAQGFGAAAGIFQLSLRHPDAVFAELVERVVDAGFRAVCVTADAPVVGVRRRDRRNRFEGRDRLALGNFPRATTDNEGVLDDTARAQSPMSWAHLREVMAAVPLPFAVKGVLTAEDARAAVDAGAAAVYVSNHGGRQLDRAPATLDQLAEIVDAVGEDVEVAFDGGVRSGADVAIALALGARVVLVGRPAAWGLAAGGASGVARVLAILHDELVTTIALLGLPNLAALDRSVLQPSVGRSI
ncbi:MAG: hypothetical protein EXQ79_02370 [Acidimicrobiia bacterium]|nr:hypothetical protein [Acidimicrobiia bacterium]